MSSSLETTTWPPKALSTVVVPASHSILPMYASTKISAPASVVFSTLLDTSNYAKWNTWCPKITIRSQPDASSSPTIQLGTHFTLHVIMDASKPSKFTDTALRVTDLSTPENQSNYVSAELLQDASFTSDLSRVYRVAWSTEGGFLAMGLRGERFHEIIVLGEEECEVRTWECLGGLLARTVKWLYADLLMKKFELWLSDLKRECETKNRGAGRS